MRLTDFHDSLLKGNVFKELVKTLFSKSGYLVVPFGFESQLSSIRSQLTRAVESQTALKIRSSPDLLVYDRASRIVNLVEVKMSSYKEARLNHRQLENYREYWDDAILILVLPFENVFYAQEIHNLGFKYRYDPKSDFIKIQEMFDKIHEDDVIYFGKIARSLISAMRKKNELETDQNRLLPELSLSDPSKTPTLQSKT